MEEVFAVLGLFTLPLSIMCGMAWWSSRKELRIRRDITRELGGRPLASTDVQRLEQAIEAIALEVERLAEGQRFVARLLSERSMVERSREHPNASPSSLASPNVITPH